MTDQIPADKVRPILDEWERIKEYADWEDMDNLVQGVRSLLPPPPPPTLADMTLDEQAECAGMQADLAQGDRVVILDGTPGHDGRVQVLESSLDVYCPVAALVTPRPDLPRMEWPGDAPAPSTLTVGSVWDDADALTLACGESGRDQIVVSDQDGYAYVWDEMAGWWEGSAPPRSAPYTIIHTGFEAGQ